MSRVGPSGDPGRLLAGRLRLAHVATEELPGGGVLAVDHSGDALVFGHPAPSGRIGDPDPWIAWGPGWCVVRPWLASPGTVDEPDWWSDSVGVCAVRHGAVAHAVTLAVRWSVADGRRVLPVGPLAPALREALDVAGTRTVEPRAGHEGFWQACTTALAHAADVAAGGAVYVRHPARALVLGADFLRGWARDAPLCVDARQPLGLRGLVGGVLHHAAARVPRLERDDTRAARAVLLELAHGGGAAPAPGWTTVASASGSVAVAVRGPAVGTSRPEAEPSPVVVRELRRVLRGDDPHRLRCVVRGHDVVALAPPHLCDGCTHLLCDAGYTEMVRELRALFLLDRAPHHLLALAVVAAQRPRREGRVLRWTVPASWGTPWCRDGPRDVVAFALPLRPEARGA